MNSVVTEEKARCSICETSFTGKFCNNCGQKISRRKTTFLTIIGDFFANFLDFERSALATLIKLISNPKFVINNYIAGNRRYFDSPSRVLFYALAIAAFHAAFFDSVYMLGGGIVELNKVKIPLQFLMFGFSIILLPMTSYFSFIRGRHSLTKHLVSILYLYSCFYIPFLIFTDLSIVFIESESIEDLSFPLLIITVLFWNARVFSPKTKFHYIVFYAALQFILLCGIITGLWFLINSQIPIKIE